jgi:hypothetical protein
MVQPGPLVEQQTSSRQQCPGLALENANARVVLSEGLGVSLGVCVSSDDHGLVTARGGDLGSHEVALGALEFGTSINVY